METVGIGGWADSDRRGCMGGWPADHPDSLTNAQYVELIAFLLKENGYPASEDDLTTDLAVLKRLMFKTS